MQTGFSRTGMRSSSFHIFDNPSILVDDSSSIMLTFYRKSRLLSRFFLLADLPKLGAVERALIVSIYNIIVLQNKWSSHRKSFDRIGVFCWTEKLTFGV